MVIDEDRRGDREAFANAEEVEVLVTSPPYPEYIAAIVEGGVRAVETAGRSPEQYMPALKAMHLGSAFAQG
jgi:hypothetical protein